MTELALTAKTIGHEHLPNGMTRLWIDIDTTEYPKALELVTLEGQPLGVIPLQHQPASYGQEAKALFASKFFHTRSLYTYIGSDDQYQKWCRKANKCTHTGRMGHDNDRIEFCHFRSVSVGSGMGIKPKYSGIPMLHSSHHEQTCNGYSAVGGKDWFDGKAKASVRRWAQEILKGKLGYEHWNQVPPRVLFDWACDMNVDRYLPKAYKFKKSESTVSG